MDRNEVDYEIALELSSHEAIVRQAYRDSRGIWTWCVGITSASGHSVERYIKNPQPLDYCLKIFVWALQRYAQEVNEAFAGVPLTKAQFAAALSFHWNTGAIKTASWVKKFRAGDIAGAKKSFMDWRKPAEIVPRREKERDLFFSAKWSNDGRMTEYTRVKANGTPDWSSARKINVEKDLRAAFAEIAPPPPVPAPETPPAPTRPTEDAAPPPLPAETVPAPAQAPATNLFTIIFNLVAALAAFFRRAS
ncbi:hypothetical protein C5748_24830 [Phyllobacterium phragmitis]|uniref:Lysozyme n=1 Tax=Phyllobacterium phragmitis TaxID=2670329 RepID=A0A2S9IJZ8_9HYPH|nr:lysozyme [Phyllobacterium phragmitis]PRD40863.1 hypothetical protein C5748_24830 [Phyllobacterium phragmitis]